MTSAERVKAALKRKQPDRVPVVEFLIDEKVARAASPGCRDEADCMDRLGFDAVCCVAEFRPVKRNGDGTYVDEWGATYRDSAEAVAHPIKGPIQTLADAEAYTAPDPNVPHRLGALEDLVQRYKGKRAICFRHRAAFMWAAYLMDIDGILMNFLAEPALVELVMDKVLDANIAVARRAVKAGAEIVILGDDYAHNHGPMMSPAVFEQFILPRLKKMVDAVHEKGGLCIKHTDGNIYPILDMIVSAGPDAINPIEPVAGMELGKVKRLVGDKVCLVGNIDCGELLSRGTVDQVKEAVRQAIEDAGEGGGYIVSSSNSVHSSCKPENVVAMVEATHEFGVY